MSSADEESPRDDRFFTPRACAASARSTSSYGTARSYATSSTSETEGVDRRFMQVKVPAYRKTDDLKARLRQQSTLELMRRNIPRPHTSNIGYRQMSNHPCRPMPIHTDQETFLSVHNRYGASAQSHKPTHSTEFRGDAPSVTLEEVLSLARHNRVDKLEQILAAGFDPNQQDRNGNTILTVACQNGNKRVVKYALRHGAEVNLRNVKGKTALHFCFK